MTRRALIPNFAFEFEIAGRPTPPAAREQAQRWRLILRLAPGFDEALPIDECPEPDEVVAWGFSQEARTLAGEAAAHWPAVEVVRAANDKRTSHAIERELGVSLREACVVASLDDLNQAILALDGAWIAKHPFGVSGRDQVRGTTKDVQARARAARLLEEGFGLVLEPLVTIEREWSVHFDIDQHGDVLYRGATELLTDRHGAFRGNVAPVTDLPQSALEAARVAAQHLAELDYRGPLGVDGHLGTLHGQPVVRPIGEINARLTFGRLALWLADSFGGRRVAWHHHSRRRASNGLAAGQSSLPDSIDPAGRSGTAVEVLGTWTDGA